MSPKIIALKLALEEYDRHTFSTFARQELRASLLKAAQHAGFDPHLLLVQWARYTVAVGEVADQIAAEDEPEPVSLTFAFAPPEPQP